MVTVKYLMIGITGYFKVFIYKTLVQGKKHSGKINVFSYILKNGT